MIRNYFFLLLFFSFSVLSAQQDSDLHLGLQYYKDSEYEKAVEYLKGDPLKNSHPQAYEPLFGSYLAMEELKDAEDIVQHYLKRSRLNQMDLLGDLLYVNKLMKDERGTEKALEEIRNRIRRNPGLAYSAGNALQRRGYARLALEMFQLAQEVNPNLNFDYQKALLYGELGDIQNMYRMYVSIVERSPHPNLIANVKTLIAQGLAQEGAEVNTDYLKELLVRKIQDGGPQTLNDLLVFIFIQEENFRGAFTQLRALSRRSGGNRSDIYNLGMICLNNQEYELAEDVFGYVLDAGPNNPFYEEALVQTLAARQGALEGNPAAGSDEWRKLQSEYVEVREKLKGQPEVGRLNISLAHLTAFRLNDLDSAISILENTIKTGYISKEDVALAKIELADILLYSGDRWEAIIYYGQAEKAFEQSPIGQEAKFKRARAAYFIGDFEWAMGIFDALKASTSKLIANDAMKYSLLINDHIALDTTTDAMKIFARADLMNYQDKQDSALVLLNQLEKEYPGHSLQDDVLLLRSEIYINRKKFHEATLDLQAILDNHSDGILADDALFSLAKLHHEELDEKEKAQEYYQLLFTTHTDSFYASEARRIFRELRGDVVH